MLLGVRRALGRLLPLGVLRTRAGPWCVAPCADGVKLDTEEENVDPRCKSARENSPAHETKRNCQISGAQLSLGNTQRVLARISRIETSSVHAWGLRGITGLALLEQIIFEQIPAHADVRLIDSLVV